MRERALVMAVEGHRTIVLLPGGKFQKVRLDHPASVGQEVWLESRQGAYRYAPSAVAAAILLIAIGVAGPHFFGSPPAVAAFSLDFAPSIDFGVSKDGRVVSTKAFNPAGRRLLQQAKVMGMPAKTAALTLTRIGVADHMVSAEEPYVLVGGVVGQGSGAWFKALAQAEVTLVRKKKWGINVVVAETHGSPAQYSHVGESIGRSLLIARSFSAVGKGPEESALPKILSRSGVLAASSGP